MSEKPVALVTGGSRGIGRGICEKLAGMGYDIVMNHVSPVSEALEQAVSAVEDCGVNCLTIRADISKADDRSKLIEGCREVYEHINVLVNNAGVAPVVREDLLKSSEESFNKVLETNLKGPFFLTQAIANWMLSEKKQDPKISCRIVNISSISAYTSSVNRGEYCISKAGVSMMTQLFADRLAAEGIGVFEVRPGLIETDMTSAVHDKYLALIEGGLIPQKRWGKPEDISNCVAAIAEGRLDFCQGQILDADGGFHLRRL